MSDRPVSLPPLPIPHIPGIDKIPIINKIPGISGGGSVLSSLDPSSIFKGIINIILGWLFGSRKSSLSSAIKVLAQPHAVNFNAGWIRQILSVELAFSFLMVGLSGIWYGVQAVRSNSLEAFVGWIRHAISVLVFAPFIPAIVMAFSYLCDLLTKFGVALGSLDSGKTSWQKTLLDGDIGSFFLNKLIGYVEGVLLRMEVAPFGALGVLWVMLFTLTVGLGTAGNGQSRLFRWTISGVVASLGSVPLMVFVLALGGNILSHLSAGLSVSLSLWVVFIASLVPVVLFFSTASSIKSRQKAARLAAERTEVVNTPAGNGSVQSADAAYANSLASTSQTASQAARAAGTDKALELAIPALAGAAAATFGPIAGGAVHVTGHTVRGWRQNKNPTPVRSGGNR